MHACARVSTALGARWVAPTTAGAHQHFSANSRAAHVHPHSVRGIILQAPAPRTRALTSSPAGPRADLLWAPPCGCCAGAPLCPPHSAWLRAQSLCAAQLCCAGAPLCPPRLAWLRAQLCRGVLHSCAVQKLPCAPALSLDACTTSAQAGGERCGGKEWGGSGLLWDADVQKNVRQGVLGGGERRGLV